MKRIIKNGTEFLVSEDVEDIENEDFTEMDIVSNLDNVVTIFYDNLGPFNGTLIKIKSTNKFLIIEMGKVNPQKFFKLIFGQPKIKQLVIGGIESRERYLHNSLGGSPEHCVISLKKNNYFHERKQKP
jgi:hypothetical protein